MLKSKLRRVSVREGKQPAWILELRDHNNPQGRATNLAIPFSWEGICSLQELFAKVVSREGDIVEASEKKVGTNEFQELCEGEGLKYNAR